jgi:HEAT repeat protein
MAYGFAAARALGMIAGDMQAADLAPLVSSDNVWLRAGVLEGLAERGDPRIAPDLERLLTDAPSAILEEEARYALRVLRPASGGRQPPER